MKYLAFITLLISFSSYSCQFKDEDSRKDHFLEAMNNSPIIVIATVERTYHRKDKCTVKKHCADSGLVIHVNEIVKGEASTFIEAYKGIYSSCYSGELHPFVTEKIEGIYKNLPSYSVGKDYVFVLRKVSEDFIVVAGKELELSLMLLKKYRE
jgi:hypothetical protein